MENKIDISETIIQSLPIPLFLIDLERRVQRMNRASEEFTRTSADKAYMRRGGEVLRCINSYATERGCGFSDACPACPVRQTVVEAITLGKVVYRKPATLTVRDSGGGDLRTVHVLLTTKPIAMGSDILALLFLEDISELIQLRDIIPICSSCKKIRNEDEYWQSVESYLESKFDVMVSHGLCNDCAKKLYPE